MLAAERRQKIKEILLKNKSIDVATLSKMLKVSDVTIRRDLDTLEEEGFLTKTYGGAILNEPSSEKGEPKYESSEEARRIGSMASQMVKEGDVIFLSPGPICLEIAKNIRDVKHLRVITNDIIIAYELHDCINVKVSVTGGDIFENSTVLVGQMAFNNLNNIFINKAFIYVNGINLEHGYTLDSYEEAAVLNLVIDKSQESIIVAEHDKFDKLSFVKLCDLTGIEKVVSSSEIPEEYKKFFFENSIQIYAAYGLDDL